MARRKSNAVETTNTPTVEETKTVTEPETFSIADAGTDEPSKAEPEAAPPQPPEAPKGKTDYIDPDLAITGKNSRVVEAADYEQTVIARAIDIAKRGQLQPIEVRKDGDNIVINFGQTRRDAVVKLKEGFTAVDPDTGEEATFKNPDVKLWVVYADVDEKEAFLRGIRENLQRKDTTPLQDAKAQDELRKTYKWSDAEIARFYGESNQNRVLFLKKLLKLPKKIQDRVHAGSLALHAALLTDSAKLTDEEKVTLVETAGQGKDRVDGAALKELVRELIAKKDAAGGEEGDDEGGDGGKGKKKGAGESSLKRNAKDFAKFVEGFVGDTENPPKEEIANLFQVLNGWFANEKSDRQLLNAIAKLS